MRLPVLHVNSIATPYVLDWITVCFFWTVSFAIEHIIPIYEREINVLDPSINFPHTKQQIGGGLNHAISLYVPIGIAIAIGFIKRSKLDVHHALLAASSGSGLSRLITEYLKNRVGCLRPDFLSRCEWDANSQTCTGSVADIYDGRKSFPSGHSSTAFSGMTFLSLYLTAQLSIFLTSSSQVHHSMLSSKLFRLLICILPLFYASWVAISRVEDYRHHVEDILAGSLIGFVSAVTCFCIYWEKPFSTSASTPRPIYSDESVLRPNTDAYHVAPVEDV